jgi:hypothetical protein
MDLLSTGCILNCFSASRLPGLIFCVASVIAGAMAEEENPDAFPETRNEFLPATVAMEDFDSILNNPPFRRSLALSDSIVLTGVARIEGDVFATLVDTETSESHLVSETANSEGWQLVDVSGDETDLESLTAKIQVSGGEVVSIRYEKEAVVAAQKRQKSGVAKAGPSQLTSSQMSEAKRAAVKYKEGFSSDGYPKEPPPEVVRKLSRLSVDQRERVNRYMIGLRNQGMGMEERKAIYNQTLDRALQGRR